jgi:hypothetical protein
MSEKRDTSLSETIWFPHDQDCTTDLKLVALLANFKAAGYGVYWHIIEVLHAEPESKLKFRPYIFEAIAGKLQVDPDFVSDLVKACIEDYDLFKSQDGFFYSERVIRNKERREHIREIRVANGSKGGKARAKQMLSKSQANAKHLLKQSLSDTQANSSREEESKGNKPLGLFSGTFQSQEDSKGAGFTPQALLGGLVACCPEMKKKEAESLVQEIKLENAELIEKDLSEGLEKSVQNGEIDIIDYLKSYTQ